MGLALQNAQGEVGPPKKLKTSSLSPPGRGGQRPALMGILKTQGEVASGGLGGLARPGPLRTAPRTLERGHLVPGSHWPPRLPLRGANPPSPSLWDRVSGSLPLLPAGLSQAWSQPPGNCQGFSQRGPGTHKTRTPGFTPNLSVCMF